MTTVHTVQRVLCWLFARIYRRWLWNSYFNNYDRVERVKGWRTATVSRGRDARPKGAGARACISPCFWIFDWLP